MQEYKEKRSHAPCKMMIQETDVRKIQNFSQNFALLPRASYGFYCITGSFCLQQNTSLSEKLHKSSLISLPLLTLYNFTYILFKALFLLQKNNYEKKSYPEVSFFNYKFYFCIDRKQSSSHELTH
jgi:hypothetical protein